MADIDANQVEATQVEENDTKVLRARSAKPHQRAKSARYRSQHAKEVNKVDMSAGSLSSVDSGTGSVHQDDGPDSSEDDFSPSRDPDQPAKRVDQTIPWRKERPTTSVSARRQRPKSKIGSAKSKSNSRPKSCHISSQYTPEHPGYVEYLRPFSAFRPPLKRVVSIPDAFSNSHLLQHPSLSTGQKTYLWHTASVYSLTNLKELQQKRYENMIQHQLDIGLHNPKDCERYIKYLLGERQRQFEVDPRIWRNPPRITPKGRYYHKRDKTVDYESEEDDADVQSEPPQRRPQTAVSSSGYGRPTTSKTPSKPAYEKRFPSGQPTDQQLYYDTKVRQLKSPDQREKDEEKKKKERKKKKRERSKKRDKTEQNTTKKYLSEAQDSEDNSLEKKEGNSKEKEHSEYKNNTEENVESQKREIRKKPSRTVKKDSPRRDSIKNSKGKANPKEDGNTKQVKSRRRSIKKDKSPKELEKEALNENNDADSRAIETVKQNNDHENALDKDEITPAFNDQPSDEKPVDDTTEFNSQVQIFVGEEPDEDFDKEEEDELGEFMFENRLRQQKPDDTISVYSSFSVDMAITKTPAPSELEY
ncbi:uncharacterized protein DDB_G0290301-like isoform X2 [Anneissia japonica]|uniref:uncharacterized protein DDB_G0290301-like isoform X2 n=1 Tax=Anneissia japonica TaxID=1529436 RepID=UPI001425B326|nr:uncharacterized protein DDB_G0290301-like isoform X2 [Anneissia japonica]